MKSNHQHSEASGRISETSLLVLSVTLVLFLIYTILPVVSPFVVTAVILFLLYPLRHNPHACRILWAAGIFFIVWFFGSLIGVLTPFIIAFLIAYIFNPLIGIFERRGVPRWASSLIVIIIILGGIVGFFFLMIPVIVTQSANIIQNISGFAQGAMEFIRSGRIVYFLEQQGVSGDQVNDFLTKTLPARLEGVLKGILEAFVAFLTNISTVVSQLLNLIIIPFVAFYLLKDYSMIMKRARKALPVRRRDKIVAYFDKVDAIIGSYLRGTLTVSLIQGVLTTVGLWIIGVQYAVVLGIITGVLNLIPYAGFYSSLIFAVIAALVSGGSPMVKVISTIILYVGLNLLETTVFSPKIVGAKVGLHPVLLIISLVAFGYFLGFVGLLVAVPTTAMIIMTVKIWHANRNADEVAEAA